MMKQFTKLLTIILFLLLSITSLTYSSDILAINLLKKAHINQRLIQHSGILKTMAVLRNGTSYSVVNIYQKNNKIRTDYKSGDFAGQSIIDDGKKAMHINLRNKTIIASSVPFSVEDLSSLLLNYEVIQKGSEIIAGQQSQILHIIPKTKGNPSIKLWIDKKTFLILKKEYYNSDGKLVMSTFYTKIDYSANIKDEIFIIPKDLSYIESQEMQKMSKSEISEAVSFDIIEPYYLPAGYILDGYYLFNPRTIKGHKRFGAHLRYRDGLNSISILEVAPPGKGHKLRKMKGWLGGSMEKQDHEITVMDCKMLDNLQGRAMKISFKGLNITIVGDISEEELTKIANSIK